jgi:hypothetical protein
MPFTQKVKRFFPLSTAEGLGGLTIPAALQAWCSGYHRYHACAWHGQQACPTAEFRFIGVKWERYKDSEGRILDPLAVT